MNKYEKKDGKNVCLTNEIDAKNKQTKVIDINTNSDLHNLYVDQLEYHYYKMSA